MERVGGDKGQESKGNTKMKRERKSLTLYGLILYFDCVLIGTHW